MGHRRGYLRLAAGVSALAGLDAVLILEVAFQHLLALILSMGARLKNNCFGIHGLVTYALLACGLVTVCREHCLFLCLPERDL